MESKRDAQSGGRRDETVPYPIRYRYRNPGGSSRLVLEFSNHLPESLEGTRTVILPSGCPSVSLYVQQARA